MSLVLNFIKGQLQRHAAAKAAAAAAKAAASAAKRSASSSNASASASVSATATASASASSAVSAVKAAPIAIAMAIASVLGGGSAKAVTAATAAKAATASTAASLSGSERITRTDAGTCLSDANASKHEPSCEGVLASSSHGSEDSSLGASDSLASSARDAGLQATSGEASGALDAGCPTATASSAGDAVGYGADSAVRSAEQLDDWDERLRRGAIAAEAEYREMLRKAEERSALEHGYSSLGMGLIGTPSSLFTVPRGQPIGITPSEVMPRDPLNYGQMYAFKGSPLAPRDPASPHMLDITAKQCRGLSIDEVLNEQH